SFILNIIFSFSGSWPAKRARAVKEWFHFTRGAVCTGLSCSPGEGVGPDSAVQQYAQRAHRQGPAQRPLRQMPALWEPVIRQNRIHGGCPVLASASARKVPCTRYGAGRLAAERSTRSRRLAAINRRSIRPRRESGV